MNWHSLLSQSQPHIIPPSKHNAESGGDLASQFPWCLAEFRYIKLTDDVQAHRLNRALSKSGTVLSPFSVKVVNVKSAL